MNKFKLTPLMTSLLGVMFLVPLSSDAASQGDAGIYSSGTETDQSPTIMLVVEGSTFTNDSDFIPQKPADLPIISSQYSQTVPAYKRAQYFGSLSNPGGRDQNNIYPTRLTKMKDAIFYLLDTPDLLPADYRVGLTRYSLGTEARDNPGLAGDSTTAGVLIAAKELGPVIKNYPVEKSRWGELVEDSNGNVVDDNGKKYTRIQKYPYRRWDLSFFNAPNAYTPLVDDGKVLPNRVYKKDNTYYERRLDGQFVANDKGNFKLNASGQYVRINDTDFIAVQRIQNGVDPQPRYTQICGTTNPNYVAGGQQPKYLKSQRCAIKQAIADMCADDQLCTGEAPMAAAYTEAGAYMMGTLTATLSQTPTPTDAEANKDKVVWPRVFRRVIDGDIWSSNDVWQLCLPRYRVNTKYLKPGTTSEYVYRSECPETVTDVNGNTINPWITVSATNLAANNWPGTNMARGYSRLTAAQKQYDYLWYPLGNRPHGTGDLVTPKPGRQAPARLSTNPEKQVEFEFERDEFKYINPGTDANGNPTSGTRNTKYEYWLDATVAPSNALYPEILYRAFRLKQGTPLTRNLQWQYCAFEDAILVDYSYSSYRLTCKEEDWKTVSKNDHGFAKVRGVSIDWECSGTNCWVTNKPKGTDAIYRKSGIEHYFVSDAMLNPYDGYQYYYDAYYRPTNRNETRPFPALPKTINTGYASSGMRNAPPEVRDGKTYVYKRPNYSECSSEQQVDSSGQKSQDSIVNNTIIFITAGWPRSTIRPPTNEMNLSLTKINPNNVSQNPDPVGGTINCTANAADNYYLHPTAQTNQNPSNNHWNCMGEYALRLNSTDKNPAGIAINTGVFVFTSTQDHSPTIPNNNTDPAKCSDAKTISLRNACLLASSKYGDGGFFQSTTRLVAGKPPITDDGYKEFGQAIVDMANPDGASTVGMIPTSMPIVPANPLNRGHLLDYGYMPLMQPNTGSPISQWTGNLRKYKIAANGVGFIDKNNFSPFNSAQNGILFPYTLDFWSKTPVNTNIRLHDKASEQSGGVYANLPYPSPLNTANTRKVFVSSDTANQQLQQYTPSNISSLSIAGMGTGEQNKVKQLLLNYMGYTIDNYTSTTSSADIISSYDATSKSLGGVFHSDPIALISKAERNSANPAGYDTVSQYIVYGGMDNALHVIDDDTGEEVLAYFPQQVLANSGQYKAITHNLKADEGENAPSFGVDGPWESYASYKYSDGSDDVLEAEKLYVYGGARLGAKAYYGLNLSKIEDTNFKPSQIFTITPDTVVDGIKPFARLGYTWAKPVITHIKWQGKRRLVAILSGGYDDTAYDKPDGLRDADGTYDDVTLGNAIYIVDAEPTIKDADGNDTPNPNVGKPLIVATNKDGLTPLNNRLTQGITSISQNNFSAGNVNTANSNKIVGVYHNDLKYSIVSSVKIMDRDSDELTDHIYFADLNGQVFRMDINNNASKPSSTSGNTSDTASDAVNSSVRVIRLASLNNDYDSGSSHPIKSSGPRFYETPVVTIQSEYEDGNLRRFATVSLASGDRSNPLRGTDPTNELKAFEFTYQDTADKRTVKAKYGSFKETSYNSKGEKVETTVTKWGFVGDPPVKDSKGHFITIDPTTGQVVIAPRGRKLGTSVSTTVRFVTNYELTSETDSTSDTGNLDPLAAKINIGTNGGVVINLPKTDTLDAKYKLGEHVYTVYDKDITSPYLFDNAYANLLTKDILIGDSSRSSLDDTNFPMMTGSSVSSNSSSYAKNGWRGSLKRFGEKVSGSYKNNGAIKAIGPASAVNNKLFVATFNPNDGTANTSGCVAQVMGSTEIYQFCLPYGICGNSGDQYQRISAGKGIVPLTWVGGDNGTRNLVTQNEYTTLDNDNGTGTVQNNGNSQLNDGGSSFSDSFQFKSKLIPLQWYDYMQQKQSSSSSTGTGTGTGTGTP